MYNVDMDHYWYNTDIFPNFWHISQAPHLSAYTSPTPDLFPFITSSPPTPTPYLYFIPFPCSSHQFLPTYSSPPVLYPLSLPPPHPSPDTDRR